MAGKNFESLSLFVELASLAATLAIPVVLYFVARRGEVATREILRGQRQLLESMRIDDLTVQAEKLESRSDLNLILDEALTIEDAAKRARIFNAYWKNPAVPLSGFDMPIDERAIDVMRLRIGPKLDRMHHSKAFNELAGFISDVERLGRNQVGGEVSDWVFSNFDRGISIGDGAIRDFLRNVESPEVFSALLAPLDEIHRRLPDAAIVNVLTGVCLAYLDRINYFSDQRPAEADGSGNLIPPTNFAWTREESERKLSELMLSQLASLLHRDRLIGFSRLDATDCTIEPEVVYALVVAVAGATSFADDWKAGRALQGIQRLEIDRKSLGTFDREWRFGRAKFESHQAGLLRRYPIELPPPDWYEAAGTTPERFEG